MKIYRILSDPSCHAIHPVDGDARGVILPFDGESKWNPWIAAYGQDGPLFRVKEPAQTQLGNFFLLNSGVLVHDWQVSDDADEVEILGDDMEYLPARLEDPAMALCVQNVMGCYNCLDLDRSEFTTGSGGEILSIQKHVFHPRRVLDSAVFKIPETCRDTIYALSGRGHDDFFEFYHEREYSGLIFEEVWRD